MENATKPAAPAVKIRANGVMTKTILGELIEWTFANGKKLTFDATKSAATAQTAKMHGYAQKIGDAAAMSADETTGKPASLEDKFAAMEATIANLYAGEWNVRGESGDAVLIEAVLAHYAGKKTRDAVVKHVAGLKKAEKAKLALLPPIKKQLDRITADRAKAMNLNIEEEMKGLDAI